MKTYNILYKTKKDFNQEILKLNINQKKSSSILVQVFTSVLKGSKIIKIRDNILKVLPTCHLIGSTTDGEIIGKEITLTNTVVSITIFKETKLKIVHKTKECKDSFTLGKKLVEPLILTKPKVLILFGDGTRLNGEDFLNGIEKILPDTKIAGGMAASATQDTNTFVFTNNTIVSCGAVGVALYNDNLEVHTEYKFNWQKIGHQMTITKSDKNRVYTIDDKTAFETYAHYLGENTAKNLPKTGIEFPLIIQRDNTIIARAVIGANKQEGYLEFAGNIAIGDKVTFGYGNSGNILFKSSKITKPMKKASIESIFIYSCMARRRLMPNLIYKEIEPLNDIAPTVGFFTHGEFYKSKHTQLLNQTMTILALSEKKKKKRKSKSKRTNIISENYFNTTKALSHLVSVTSDELTKLNINLNDKNRELKTIKNNLKHEVTKQIKELRNKDKLLVHQSRLASMGEMIGNIAHQWRQPLNILGIKNMTLDMYYKSGKIDDKFMEEYNKDTSDTIQHMSNTIDDFRDFFKPDKEKENFNILYEIKRTVHVINDSFVNHNITCNINNEQNIIIYGYKNEFSQVILNLCSNAKDALKQNKIQDAKVTIDIISNKEYVTMEVKDNAGGIPDDIIHKVFDPYFTTKHKSNGTGIGLYMSKMIIENNMGGELSVENDEEGAVFTIKLRNKVFE